jgi:hypothetical protein
LVVTPTLHELLDRQLRQLGVPLQEPIEAQQKLLVGVVAIA